MPDMPDDIRDISTDRVSRNNSVDLFLQYLDNSFISGTREREINESVKIRRVRNEGCIDYFLDI